MENKTVERLKQAAFRSNCRNVAAEGTAPPVTTSKDMLDLIADNQVVIMDALVELLERRSE